MLRFAPIVALVVFVFPINQSAAAPKANCLQRSVHELQERSPDGYAVYTAISDKKFFLHWITCDNMQVDLATAVHESVHNLTENRDAFPMIDGSNLKRPHQVSKFAAPAMIAKKFNGRSMMVQTYLHRGNASSADDLLYLLDEMNAYTHDLHTSVALNNSHMTTGQLGPTRRAGGADGISGGLHRDGRGEPARDLGGLAEARSRQHDNDALDASRAIDERVLPHSQLR